LQVICQDQINNTLMRIGKEKQVSKVVDGDMPDVELVEIMHQAQKSKLLYKVKVPRWDKKYCLHWEKLINTIDTWDDLHFRYNKRTGRFWFNKRKR
jgi:hypothetical protein